MEAAEFIHSMHDTEYKFNGEVVTALKILWDEPAIKYTFWESNSTELEGIDSKAHYFEDIDRISHPTYMPTEEDVWIVSMATTDFKFPNV